MEQCLSSRLAIEPGVVNHSSRLVMSLLNRCGLMPRSSCANLLQKSRTVTTKQILSKNPPIPKNSPLSLQYEPRPTEYARYEDYYNDVIAPDMLVMTYFQYADGEARPMKTNAMREWDGSSPYHKNRPQRPPRGGKVLKPLRESRTFRNVPKISAVHVHTMLKEALDDRQKLLSAFMALQTITGETPELVLSKKSVALWKLRAGVPVAVKVKLQGPPMHQFLSTLFEVILPSLKDFTGIADSTGDTNGNLAFGLPTGTLSRFPEIEANYEQYPVLPGFHVMINTTAPNDKEARQLLTGYGLPFKKA